MDQLFTPPVVSSPFPSKTERPEVLTSANVPEIKPTIDHFFVMKTALPITSTTRPTTKASKVIHGRIPWNRLFGSGERDRILSRLKKPSIPPKTSTALQTTSVTTTPAAVYTTSEDSPDILESLPPLILTQSKESSADDNFSGLTSTDFEFTTQGPSFHPITTTRSSDYARSSTTTETPLQIPFLPSPPTVEHHSMEIPDETLSSGSGRLPDSSFVIRQRLGGTRRQQGRRRRPFRGRRPFRKPEFTKANFRTTVASIADVSTKENIIEETTQPLKFVFNNPMYTSSKKKDKNTIPVSIEQTSKETDSYSEFDWSSSGLFANKLFITSSKYNPTTTLVPEIPKHSYTTAQIRVQNKFKPPIQSKKSNTTQRSPVRRITATVESNNSGDSADKSIPFDSRTIFTEEKGHDIGSPYSKEIHKTISSTYNHLFGNKDNSPSTHQLKPAAKPMQSKPRIIGGNAASFTVLSNSDAFLPCEAVGNPQPVITWKRFSSTTGMKHVIVFGVYFMKKDIND